jgi:hypothetical protein
MAVMEHCNGRAENILSESWCDRPLARVIKSYINTGTGYSGKSLRLLYISSSRPAIILQFNDPVCSLIPVATAWRFLGLRMKETASRYGR